MRRWFTKAWISQYNFVLVYSILSCTSQTFPHITIHCTKHMSFGVSRGVLGCVVAWSMPLSMTLTVDPPGARLLDLYHGSLALVIQQSRLIVATYHGSSEPRVTGHDRLTCATMTHISIHAALPHLGIQVSSHTGQGRSTSGRPLKPYWSWYIAGLLESTCQNIISISVLCNQLSSCISTNW